MPDPKRPKLETFQYVTKEGVAWWIDVGALRKWAEAHCELEQVPVSLKKTREILKSNMLDRDHLLNHTLRQPIRPIITCRDFHTRGGEIIDGNHTYVAIGIIARARQQRGLRQNDPLYASGYIVTRKQMQPFTHRRTDDSFS